MHEQSLQYYATERERKGAFAEETQLPLNSTQWVMTQGKLCELMLKVSNGGQPTVLFILQYLFFPELMVQFPSAVFKSLHHIFVHSNSHSSVRAQNTHSQSCHRIRLFLTQTMSSCTGKEKPCLLYANVGCSPCFLEPLSE